MSTELQKKQAFPIATPAVDVLENDDTWRVVADLPGVEPDDLLVRVEKGTLVLEGTWAPDFEGELLQAELSGRTWRRSFSIPRTVDVEHVSAHLEHGVVTIDLPKSAAHRPRRIPVHG